MPVPLLSNDKLIRARPLWPVVVIGIAAAVGYARGLGLALLILAGGALLLAIAMVWQSVQSLSDESAMTLEEALALGAPSAEEERKRAVLRALKDLEYERSVGKVSDEDYARLSAHYRAEAKRLLQLLEEEQVPARERAEKALARRLEREAIAPPKKKAKLEAPPPEPEAEAEEEEAAEAASPTSDEPAASAETEADEAEAGEDEAGEDEAEEAETAAAASKTCEACETVNDADARFCKSCGGRL